MIKMIRNLKTLGLMAVAAMAMSAMFASAAQADPEEPLGVFKGGETPSSWADTTIHGAQYGTAEDNYFEMFESRTTCANSGVTFTGTIEGGTATELTVQPHYNDCTAGGLPMTVDTSDCGYVFTQPTRINGEGSGEYTGKADLTCEEGKAVVISIYLNAGHTLLACTIEVFPNGTSGGGHDTEELDGHVLYKNNKATVTEDPEVIKDDVTVNATIDGISARRSGAFCPTEETSDAEYRNLVTVTGKSDKGKHDEHYDVWIEDHEEE